MGGDTGETGDFLGHAIPAVCFLGFGLFFLLLSLKRSRTLAPGQSFCETFVPEKSISLKRNLGITILTLTSFGILYEGFGGCLSRYDDNHREGCFFHQSAHMILYLVYGAVAPILLLEASHKLPPDSSRLSLSLALLLAYILWHEHSLMKDDPTDNRVHALMAQICLVNAVVMLFSVLRPQNLVAYIAGWGLFVLKALWLFTAGINAEFHKISIHLVAPIFCLEVVVVTLSIVFVGVSCGGGSGDKDSMETMNGNVRAVIKPSAQQSEYERLQVSESDVGEHDERLDVV